MTRPPFRDYVSGNILFVGFFWFMAAFSAYGCLTGQMPFWVPLLIWLMAGTASNSRARVMKYRAWQAEWNAINTPLPASANPSKPAWRMPGWLVALAACGIGIRFLTEQNTAPGPAMLVIGMGAVALYYAGRWLRRRITRPKPRFAPVSINIDIPNNSPSAAQSKDEVPDYAKSLLNNGKTFEVNQ